jgi:hypothetical protein
MTLPLLLLAVLPAADDSAEPYFKFPKDSVWTYSMPSEQDRAKKETITMTVVGDADGKVSVDMVAQGDRPKTTRMTWYVADGLFFWAEKKGETLSDNVALYKLGSKKGDSWSVAKKEGSPAQSATHLGTEELKVGAGTYKEAIHTKLTLEQNGHTFDMDVYLVERVGVVKMVYSAGQKVMSLELESFKPAK